MQAKDAESELTAVQAEAVNWDEGALLVLAGPGSGKTKVLTNRIARILTNSRERSFRVLALTFTNKAADEMFTRVQALCDGEEERAVIGTFHSFCMQMLRQHGTHIGVPPDFSIYSQETDRREALRDGLRRASPDGSQPDTSLVRYLQLIDRLKGKLVSVEDSAGKFADPTEGRNVALAYRAYEDELKRANALDFNSLILRAYELISKFEGIGATYRRTYKYWLIDEFQDTNPAQYRFLTALAGGDFRNIFVVADDDQIIYQWNGASYQQLQKFRADFKPHLIQLPKNYRCPAPIVRAANNLVTHNVSRTPSKQPLEVGKINQRTPDDECILLGHYDSDTVEAQAVAEMIKTKPQSGWGETVVIARTRALLDKFKEALTAEGVRAAISQRRDDFVSSEFTWLHTTLKQAARPLDQRNFDAMVSAFNKWRDTRLSADFIVSAAGGSSRSLLEEWSIAVTAQDPSLETIGSDVLALSRDNSSYRSFIDKAIALFGIGNSDCAPDISEDAAAWKDLSRAIVNQLGRNPPLDEFLQLMALQSKEPPPAADTVTLMTIHAAKGKEFDYVYVVGLAESVLPSYQSVQAGPQSAEMEEERRNCFVAITRTKEQLVLTLAKTYKGYAKRPSRFIAEMGFATP